MYLGDPREMAIRPESGITLESDNRKETMYHWGAQILDLCDMSPEDYKNSTQVVVKTIIDCGECGGGSGPSAKTENVGQCKIEDDVFFVNFAQAVNSELFIFVTAEDAEGTEFTFDTSVSEGESSAECDVPDADTYVKPFMLRSVKLSLKNDPSQAKDTETDDKYEYSTDFEGDVVGKTFFLSILCTETDNLTGEDYAEIIRTGAEGYDYIETFGEIDFGDELEAGCTFYIPCNHIQWESEEAEEEYCETHAYDFVILTQHTVDKISEGGVYDITNEWTNEPIVIDDSDFRKMVKRDLSPNQCAFDYDDECAPRDFDYTIKIIK